jgi:hypothetical protein
MVTASATLTSSGSLSAWKSGDVLTYTVAVTGDQGVVTPAEISVAGISVPVAGGPWTFTLPETFAPPTVTGMVLTFIPTVDPHVYKATIP